jgi:hypothetical protein
MRGDQEWFVRPSWPVSSRSRATLSFVNGKFGDGYPGDDLGMLSFLDNDKLGSPAIEHADIHFDGSPAPFFVTPFLLRDIYTTTRMNPSGSIDTRPLFKIIADSIAYGSRSGGDINDRLFSRFTKTMIKPVKKISIPCGPKKNCCPVKNAFETCNCKDDVVEVIASDRLSRIPRCMKRYANLENLFASKSGLYAIENLEGLGHLKIVDLSGNSIKSINGLEKTPSIERLSLKDNSLENISGIDKVTSLRSLDIRENSSINDLRPVEKLDRLSHLLVQWNALDGENHDRAVNLSKRGVFLNPA